MSSVMIRCPNTARPVSTEIETEPNVFRELPNIRARMHCPACGRDHFWRLADAWLEGEPGFTHAQRPPGTEAA